MSANQFVRNNENLKAANYTEHITKDEFHHRVSELAKCKADPIYFAENYYEIITLDHGQHKIKMYDKQKDLVKAMVDKRRVVVLSPRQSGKTTSYCIYSLWEAIFQENKRILICGQTDSNAMEFLSNIRLGYENLPFWLKPGIVEWNKKKIVFANGSFIKSAVTSPSVRGGTISTLILDEFAIIPSHIVEEFWTAVYPTISSGKKSKIFMVSTPCGISNIFYNTYRDAVDNFPNDEWYPIRIRWQEVPGRDEEWKRSTIAGYCKGDMTRWLAEFECEFLGSSYTLIPSEQLTNLNNTISAPIKNMELGTRKIRIWKEPRKEHCYVMGVDIAEGVGGDYSVATIIDVTNPLQIEVVAILRDNTISPSELAYVICKLGKKYNNALLAVECNSIGKSTLDDVWNIFEYENILNIRRVGSYAKGIFCNASIKMNACMWLKDYCNASEVSIKLNEKQIIEELKSFEKIDNSSRATFQAAGNAKDDCVMSLLWAIYALYKNNVEKYFNVLQWVTTATGLQIPVKMTSFSDSYWDVNQIQDHGFNDMSNIDAAYDKLNKRLLDDSYVGDKQNTSSLTGSSTRTSSDEGSCIGFANF